MAARVYDLVIARRHIEDIRENVTRFLVVGRKQAEPTGHDKTSILLALGDSPGALYGLLRPFADFGVNMTKIESRPSRKKSWDYVFFIDVDGHESHERVSRALAAIGANARTVKVLGSYPRAQPL
jgi:chorismate mutase/prephenate dehydratase